MRMLLWGARTDPFAASTQNGPSRCSRGSPAKATVASNAISPSWMSLIMLFKTCPSECSDRSVHLTQSVAAAQADITVVFFSNKSLEHPDGSGVLIGDEQIDDLNAHAGILILQQHLRQRMAHVGVGAKTLQPLERFQAHPGIGIMQDGFEQCGADIGEVALVLQQPDRLDADAGVVLLAGGRHKQDANFLIIETARN